MRSQKKSQQNMSSNEFVEVYNIDKWNI
jgi:hypothetical protein